MAITLLRSPVLMWALVLLVVAHPAVARTLKSEEAALTCDKKKQSYLCEGESEVTCGNTPNKDDDVCPDGTTFCRIDAEELVNGQMTCGDKTVSVAVSGGTSSPVTLSLTSSGGTFAGFVGAKGGPAYCKLTPALEDYKSSITINLPTQLTPSKTYKGFSNLAFCFKPCPCNSCGLQEAFTCESFAAGTGVPAFAVASCGTGCAPVIEAARYGRYGVSGPSLTNSGGPVVNGVIVNNVCTCQNAQYCTAGPFCTSSDPGCNVATVSNAFIDVKTAIQTAIDDCVPSSNPCDGSNAFTCTQAWCPSDGEYQFWANNKLPANGDPCVGTYKYMVFSWRCGVKAQGNTP